MTLEQLNEDLILAQTKLFEAKKDLKRTFKLVYVDVEEAWLKWLEAVKEFGVQYALFLLETTPQDFGKERKYRWKFLNFSLQAEYFLDDLTEFAALWAQEYLKYVKLRNEIEAKTSDERFLQIASFARKRGWSSKDTKGLVNFPDFEQGSKIPQK